MHCSHLLVLFFGSSLFYCLFKALRIRFLYARAAIFWNVVWDLFFSPSFLTSLLTPPGNGSIFLFNNWVVFFFSSLNDQGKNKNSFQCMKTPLQLLSFNGESASGGKLFRIVQLWTMRRQQHSKACCCLVDI